LLCISPTVIDMAAAMNTTWEVSIVIYIISYGATSSLTGSGAFVETQETINAAVTTLPSIYQSFPHPLISGITQNNCAIPVTTKNIDMLESKPIKNCTNKRCKIPASPVDTAAA
jgi:hypothetical protein